MIRTSLPRAAVAALALLASNALFAQAPPVIVIDFGSRSVPLDSWSTVGAALLIAIAAYLWARRRATNFSRLPAWIAVVAAAIGMTMMASKLDLIGAAQAVSVNQVTLTTSPAVIQVGTGFALLEVTNGTGGTVTIASVTLQNPAQGQHIVEAKGTNCKAGLALAASAICYIAVDTFQPG